MTTHQDTLGLIAGTLTTVSLIPQVWRIWQTQSAEDMSWLMFSIFALGNLMWFVYGLSLEATPILISSGVTLVLALVILVLKWRFSKKAAAR
jgi:MtN3 and saliva related transmembrane protein